MLLLFSDKKVKSVRNLVAVPEKFLKKSIIENRRSVKQKEKGRKKACCDMQQALTVRTRIELVFPP